MHKSRQDERRQDARDGQDGPLWREREEVAPSRRGNRGQDVDDYQGGDAHPVRASVPEGSVVCDCVL